MKILSFEPRTLAAASDLDESKLAYHAESIQLTNLSSREHGIVLVGFADDTGVKNVGGRAGAKDGPAAVRQKLYKFTFQPSLPIYDLGDLMPATTIEETHRQGATLVEKILAAGHFPLVLGGGHDLAFPHALAFQEKFAAQPTFFWNIDAHLDVRPAHPLVTSGSPWYLLREHAAFGKKAKIVEFGLQSHCNAQSLVKYAREKKFELHWLADIRAQKTTADRTFAKLLARMPAKAAGLVSLDIDSVNWAEAPGCSAPQTEGFTAAEAIAMSFASGANPRVKSFGVFELCPPLDPDGRTANLVAHAVAACIRGVAGRTRKK